jgi:hypothetical protein
MKKIILALTTLAIAGAGIQTASAGGCGGGSSGNCGWSTAGQVLAGVTAGLVIGSALAPRPTYYVPPAPVCYPTAGYGYTYAYAAPAQPAVVYTTPARIVYTAPAPVVYAAPAPVVVYRPPLYVAPPAMSVSFGYYGGHRPYCYRGGCW